MTGVDRPGARERERQSTRLVPAVDDPSTQIQVVGSPIISGMQVSLSSFVARIARLFLLLPFSIAYANTCVAVPPLKPIRHVCGIVKNPVGEKIPHARLTLFQGGKELTTTQADSNGRFDFGQIEAGHYELRAEFDGYQAVKSRIAVVRPTRKCNQALDVTLSLITCGGGIGKARN